MPSRSPFTRLCQQASALRGSGRADLHVHSTHSDGLFSPADVVERARKAGLFAVALADHDTLAGVGEAHAAAGDSLEVVAGVEITCEHEGRELHLLGYFVRPDDAGLNAALGRVRAQRAERFVEMARRLWAGGASFPRQEVEAHLAAGMTLGRRHLAQLLVKWGQARTVGEAFAVYLGRADVCGVPKLRLPVAEAIGLVRGAGGVASWAHPPEDFADGELDALQQVGLRAVECEYPWPTGTRSRRLREAAQKRGLAVTGGSDCHGPTPTSRAVGSRGVTREQFQELRTRVG